MIRNNSLIQMIHEPFHYTPTNSKHFANDFLYILYNTQYSSSDSNNYDYSIGRDSNTKGYANQFQAIGTCWVKGRY